MLCYLYLLLCISFFVWLYSSLCFERVVFGYRFVVLDGYDISMLGWPPDHPNTLVAEAILNKHNPNQNQNSPKNLEGFSRYA